MTGKEYFLSAREHRWDLSLSHRLICDIDANSKQEKRRKCTPCQRKQGDLPRKVSEPFSSKITVFPKKHSFHHIFMHDPRVEYPRSVLRRFGGNSYGQLWHLGGKLIVFLAPYQNKLERHFALNHIADYSSHKPESIKGVIYHFATALHCLAYEISEI